MFEYITFEPAADENMTDNQVENLLSLPRTGARSLKPLANDAIPPCYINKRDISARTIFHLTLLEYENALSKSMLNFLMWCICRLHSSTVSQYTFGWADFISETGQIPKRLTSIDYNPIINHLITDYSTELECLKVSKKHRERSVWHRRCTKS